MTYKNPEILSPAGDFNSAIHALNSGADAVYLGLESYSARARAKNFTIDEIRRLKTFTSENSKKIYVAINTVLKDEELKSLYPILQELEEIEIDAVIVQDLGLASIIKKYTNLTLHASTQLAVHNTAGMQMLKSAGFSRAVLSRELSLIEIEKLKKEFPEIELEIFIHGALCYGFSGLCLASSQFTNRSANKGECAQICRSWFNNNGKKEYVFSLNDLSLNEDILKLKKIGIESLKIEGRLKGPNYASLTASHYKKILNGEDSGQTQKLIEIEFSRSGHDAYLSNKNWTNNINFSYPGHIGTEVGKIIKTTKNEIVIEATDSIENRDGLQIFLNTKPVEVYKFAANIKEINGKKITLIGTLPPNNTGIVYKISTHNKYLKDEKPTKFKPWKKSEPIKIEIFNTCLRISGNSFTKEYSINTEEAKNSVDLETQFHKVFFAGGESKYCFPITIVNKTEYKNIFIPSSVLKETRNLFLDDFLNTKTIKDLINPESCNIESLSYLRNKMRIPFITNFNEVQLEELIVKNDKYLLPLNPVIFDSSQYLNDLKYFLSQHSEKFIIGLNNIGHLAFIKELPVDQYYYADYGLYVLNNFSKEFLMENSGGRLLWCTKWVEQDKPKEFPPIFISRTCFHGAKNGCPKNCPKDFEYKISQNSSQIVIVKDCISYTMIVSESLE
ncbi:MAG: U32 family peptidase [Spirochaetales bacterium]|nr:U32 family peptidase [Spirochaetales bacterium]